jgi:hypothetical protein
VRLPTCRRRAMDRKEFLVCLVSAGAIVELSMEEQIALTGEGWDTLIAGFGKHVGKVLAAGHNMFTVPVLPDIEKAINLGHFDQINPNISKESIPRIVREYDGRVSRYISEEPMTTRDAMFAFARHDYRRAHFRHLLGYCAFEMSEDWEGSRPSTVVALDLMINAEGIEFVPFRQELEGKRALGLMPNDDMIEWGPNTWFLTTLI